MAELLKTMVDCPWKVEQMRLLFNDCLGGMTKKMEPVTAEAQQEWWDSQPPTTKAFLYALRERPWEFIGFCLLTKKNDVYSPVAGLGERFRGHGYYWGIIQDYIREAGGPLVGEQLVDNAAICTINARMGWKVVGHEVREGVGTVHLLEHPGPPKWTKHREQEIYDEIIRYHGA